MNQNLFEHTSYDELDAEGRAKSRLLPLRMAIEKLKGKNNRLTIPLKNFKDYHTFYSQLVKAGSKISIPNARNEEIGPQKFEQCLEFLGIEDSTDLQDLIEDPQYREIFEEGGIKFSFSKDRRNNVINPATQARKSTGKLEEIGITVAGEGESWEWGTDEDDDMSKVAPEGRDIWVIRAHEYPDYPCMFVYPYEGSKISEYSTALDIFFMNRSKESGIIYSFYDPKKFNLMWVACPCTYDYFLNNPVPTESEVANAQARKQQEEQIENEPEYAMAESAVNKDRTILKRLVESYGKEDVMKYVNHLNESRDDDMNAVQNCVNTIARLTGCSDEECLEKVRQLLEDLVDTVQNEPYELGKADGYNENYDEIYQEGYEDGEKSGYNAGLEDGKAMMRREMSYKFNTSSLVNRIRGRFDED